MRQSDRPCSSQRVRSGCSASPSTTASAGSAGEQRHSRRDKGVRMRCCAVETSHGPPGGERPHLSAARQAGD